MMQPCSFEAAYETLRKIRRRHLGNDSQRRPCPGEKVPSVRVASRTWSVSPATVFKAYYLLEDKGLIQARARSGYYVREHAANALTEPELIRHTSEGTELGVSDLIFQCSARSKTRTPCRSARRFPARTCIRWRAWRSPWRQLCVR